MAVRYHTNTAGVDWRTLKADQQAGVFDNGRTPDEPRRFVREDYAFMSIFAWDATTVVGTGRLLADGVCNA